MEGQKVKSGEQEGDMITIEKILQEKASFTVSDILEFRNAYTDPKLNRVLGCIFGAMIGDALGAYCEFMKIIPKDIQDKVMDMPGGGTFGTILPGQYTDDTELAYHLLKGLLSFDQNKGLGEQKLGILCRIGREYVRWMKNGPFDIGTTCRGAIRILQANSERLETNFQGILTKIECKNIDSQSNGSLMRITPMAVFVALFGIDPIEEIQFIKDEIRLTHPNLNLQAAGASWVYLLSKLINRKQNQDLQELSQIMKEVQRQQDFFCIKPYFSEAFRDRSQSMSAAQQMGWAKIAYSYAYKFLVESVHKGLLKEEGDVFKNWIKWVICRAGDTDTNAAISGGLIGAVIGFQRIPLQYLKKTFELQFTQNESEMKYTTKQREYEPANVLKLVLELIKKSQKRTNNKIYTAKETGDEGKGEDNLGQIQKAENLLVQGQIQEQLIQAQLKEESVQQSQSDYHPE